MSLPDFEFEEKHYNEGYTAVCGCDEAGRGPLCGPVVAAACVLPGGLVIDGLNDSKKLTEKKREAIFDEITKNAIAYSIALATVEEINETNILDATLLAMRRAVEGLPIRPDYLIIDGNVCRGFDIPARAVVKGDATSPSIAAASILAKVTRDRMMVQYAEEYPAYAFESNKGYGTKAHYAGIEAAGICPIHRKTFLKNILEK